MKRFAACLTALALAGGAFGQEQGKDTKPDTTQGQKTEVHRMTHDDFSIPRRSQKATDLMGKKVVNGSNENLGKLEDIVVDAHSGRILYGVLSFGGFLGMGDKLFAIPWESLELPADAKDVVLNVNKDRLKNAEGFDKSHWPNFADEQRHAELQILRSHAVLAGESGDSGRQRQEPQQRYVSRSLVYAGDDLAEVQRPVRQRHS
jgi:sporulation protein YlmC with PRC-barrel domain